MTLTTGDFTSGSSFSTGFGTATYIFIDGVGQTLTCTRTIVVVGRFELGVGGRGGEDRRYFISTQCQSNDYHKLFKETPVMIE